MVTKGKLIRKIDEAFKKWWQEGKVTNRPFWMATLSKLGHRNVENIAMCAFHQGAGFALENFKPVKNKKK